MSESLDSVDDVLAAIVVGVIDALPSITFWGSYSASHAGLMHKSTDPGKISGPCSIHFRLNGDRVQIWCHHFVDSIDIYRNDSIDDIIAVIEKLLSNIPNGWPDQKVS